MYWKPLRPLVSPLLPLLALACLVACAGAQERVPTLHQDFRGGQFNEHNFRYSGTEAKEYVKPSAEGLRITLPEGKAGITVGIATRFPVEGDFTFTIRFRILDARKPTAGPSAGLNIWTQLDTPQKPAVSITRGLFAQDGDRYATGYMVNDEQGKRLTTLKTFPAASQAGRLRMAREGKMFTLSVAEEGEDVFRPLHQWEAGDAPLQHLRVACVAGGEGSAIDAVVEEATLDAAEPAVPAAAAEPTEPPASPPWPWLVGAVTGVVIVVAGATWFATRGRRTPNEAVEAEAEDDEEEEE